MTSRSRLGAALALLTAAALTGCTGGSAGAGPSSDAASTGGRGSTTITIGGTTHELAVTCTRDGAVRQAAGSQGAESATLIVAGPQQSVVLIERGDGGAMTVRQALPGLRDDTGNAVGALAVTADGDGRTFSGTGTFVVTRIGTDGKRVLDPPQPAVEGTFRLDCAQGFIAAPTASGSTKPSSTQPSSTK